MYLSVISNFYYQIIVNAKKKIKEMYISVCMQKSANLFSSDLRSGISWEAHKPSSFVYNNHMLFTQVSSAPI